MELTSFDYASLNRITRQMIESATNEIRERIQGAAQAVFEIGEQLVAVKEVLDHGLFERWVECEFPNMGIRTAQKMMSVAINLKSESPSLLQVNATPDALYQLASDTTPPAVRTAVIREAKEQGKKITPVEVKRRVAEHKSGIGNNGSDRKTELVPKREPEPPPKVIEDQEGTPIENEKIAAVFARRDELNEHLTALSRVKSAVLGAIDNKDELYRHVSSSAFKAGIENAYRFLKDGMPHALCPYHADDPVSRRQCKACGGSGWVKKEVYEQAPKSMKRGRK